MKLETASLAVLFEPDGNLYAEKVGRGHDDCRTPRMWTERSPARRRAALRGVWCCPNGICAVRSQVLARANRRRSSRAGLRGWISRIGSKGQDARLASLSGGACRPRHLLRPEARAQSR